MIDHVCRSTQKWRHILEYVQTGTSPIKNSWLIENNIEGVDAWDLSTMVESFLVGYFRRSMYNRRVQLSGGEMKKRIRDVATSIHRLPRWFYRR